MTVEQRLAMQEQRLEFLEVQIGAMRGLLTAQLAIMEKRMPGIAQTAHDAALAMMTRLGTERLGALAGSLESLVEDAQAFRDLKAND